MQYISGVLYMFITVVLFCGIMMLLRKTEKPDGGTVVLPRFMLIIGIVCCAVFLIPASVILLNDGSGVHAFVLLVISLLSSTLIVGFINCRIVYNEEYLVAKNFLGIKRKYGYNEITAIQIGSTAVKLYMGKCAVHIDEIAEGGDEFLACAKKQYRKHNKGREIPLVKPKTDFIFKGNVVNPGGHIFVYSIVVLFCVGGIILFAVASAPKKPEDLDYSTVSFSRYEVHELTLRLYTENESMYYSVLTELLSDSDKFISLCESGESFDIGFLYDEDDEPHYDIESIAGRDGTIFLTLDAGNKYRSVGAWGIGSIVGAMGLVWIVFVAVSIYVGRHPEKFSRRFIRWFFKDEHIREQSYKK